MPFGQFLEWHRLFGWFPVHEGILHVLAIIGTAFSVRVAVSPWRGRTGLLEWSGLLDVAGCNLHALAIIGTAFSVRVLVSLWRGRTGLLGWSGL